VSAPGRRRDQLPPDPAAVGFAVTFRWTISRRAWLTKISTYSVRKVSVCTVSRSAAQIDGRWLCRNVRQPWLGGDAGPRRRYRWTEALLTATPSFCSSPRIRSAPHRGLSRAIIAIRSRTSAVTRGRPTGARDRQRQNSRQPRRCQRTTVSGVTTSRCRRQSLRARRTSTQKSRSRARRRERLRVGRVRIASCWRSRRFSAIRSPWVRVSARSRSASRTM
jgi:hypothetical protein